MLGVLPGVWVSVGMSGAQAVSDRALVPRAADIIQVQSSGVQVDPHLVFLGSRIGQRFSSGQKADCCIVAPELPVWRAWGPGV